MKSVLIFTEEEYNDLLKGNEDPRVEVPKLTFDELTQIRANVHLTTLGLVLKARRILAEYQALEQRLLDPSDQVTRRDLADYAFRAELLVMDEAFTSLSNTLYLVVRVLEEKGILSQQELSEMADKITSPPIALRAPSHARRVKVRKTARRK